MRCVSHTLYLAHGNSEGEARGRNRHRNYERLVRNLEEGTKRESPKQGLTSAKDLAIELSEGRESPYHILDYLTNLTYSLIYAC